MKNELDRKVKTKFTALRLKTYSYLSNVHDEKKNKRHKEVRHKAKPKI